MTEVRLPDFLVIGAMKAGSTTLYEDLRRNPGIFVIEKELDSLSQPDVGAAGYGALFATAGPDQVTGEVSATYAKLPQTAGLAERAGRLLGERFRVVYLVRDPVDRTVSHHFHRLVRRTIDPSIDVAVRTDARLVDYSRYGMQIEPWVDLVGIDRVHLVHFERYIADRAATLAQVCAFLGARADGAPEADLSAVHNRGDERHVAVGGRGRVARSAAYRRYVRPRLSENARRWLARRILPAPPPRPDLPSAATVDEILDRTAADCARLVELFGPAAPQWDAEATRQRYERLRVERLGGGRPDNGRPDG
jgi:hypothetical protein